MPEDQQISPKTYSIGRFRIERQPRKPRQHLHAKVALATGAILTAFHDLVYRSTGGEDFEFYDTISHAGGDMLALTAVITFVLLVVPD